VAAVLAGMSHATADERLLLTEHDFFADLPVVLSATRLRQPVSEAPAAVTLIDRELIEASGARELVDILRLVPGMIVARHSNHEPVVTYGGLPERFARRMQVLVDGRSVYQPFSGGVLWPDLGLAIEDIAHIEVIRGPNAAAYGPNSFQGIINIITRHPAETRGQHVTARIGTNGVQDLIARQSGGTGDADYRMTLATQRDDGFPDETSDKRSGFGNLRLDYRLSPRHVLSTQAGLGRTRKGRGLEGDALNPPRHFTTESGHIHLRLDQDGGAGDSWTLQYYYQQNDTVERFTVSLGVIDPRINDNVRTDRHDLELQLRGQPAADTRLVGGVGLRHDRVDSSTFFGDQNPVSDDLFRLFGNVEQRLGSNTTLNLGAMYEHSDMIGDQVSPRAALNLYPRENHTVRLIATRATRTPVLTEERGFHSYPDPGLFGGQPVVLIDAEGGLNPERLDYLELGHHAVLPDRGLTVDTKLFDATVTDLIAGSLRTETNVFGDRLRSFSNRGGVRYQGVEIQADYRLTTRTRLHGGITHHFYRRDDSEQRDGRYAEAIPRYVVTAAVSSRVSDALTLSSTYYWHSEVNWIDGEPMDAYDGFLDVSARWTLSRTTHLGVTVQDVLPRGYDGRGPGNSNIYQVNRRETRSFATLSMDF
jgi:iron complex outermembrane recepter protein